jgi:hypothetical protein
MTKREESIMENVYSIRFQDICRIVGFVILILLVEHVPLKTTYAADTQQLEALGQKNLLDQSEGPSDAMSTIIKNSLPNVKFTDKHSAKKTIRDISVEFATSYQHESETLRQTGQGFLFGKFTTNKQWAMGTVSSVLFAPGTYYIWIEKQHMGWKAFATDAKGNFLASTNEVKILTKNTNKEPSLSELKGLEAHILVPNYSLSTAKGEVTTLADEGPPTVHGCECHTVMDCGHSLSCFTLCIPTRVCNCW